MTDKIVPVEQTESKETGLLVTLGRKYEVSPTNMLNAVKATIFKAGEGKKVSNEHLMAFLMVANQYDLNPFLRQIYAFESRGGIVPIVAIDGWISLVNRHPNYSGHTFEDVVDDEGEVLGVKTTMYRKDRDHPVEVTEWMVECKRDTDPWKKWPRRMIRHKSFIQCARYAFGYSGIYDDDEGQRIVESQGVIDIGKQPSAIGIPRSNAQVAKDVPKEPPQESPEAPEEPQPGDQSEPPEAHSKPPSGELPLGDGE